MRQRQLLVVFGALGTMGPVGAFLAVYFANANPYLASDLAAMAILVSMVLTLAVPFLPLADRGATPRARIIDLLIIWTYASAMAQFGWELPLVILAPWLKGVTANDHWAFLWWAYGVADTRYLIADPFTVCMEAVTSMVGGPIEIYMIYLYKKGRLRTAAIYGLVVAATQLYGTVLFFGIEALEKFKHVGTGLANVWVKFVGLNAVWLAVPVVCIYVYFKALKDNLVEDDKAQS